MLTAEQIRERLADANLSKVAKQLNMHYITLWRFMQGDSQPLYSTVKSLSDYFEKKNG